MDDRSSALRSDIELSEQERDDLQTAMTAAFRCDADAWPLLRRIGYPTTRFPSFGGHHRDAWQQVFADLEQGIVHAPYVQLLSAALRERPANAVLERLASEHGVHAGTLTADPVRDPGTSALVRSPAAPHGLPAKDPAQRRGVFLCHASADKAQVRCLYHKLTADGVECWFDEVDLRPGQDFDHEIRRALRQCRYVLACLSAVSVTRTGYLQKELRFALEQAEEQPEGAIYLIPVRLETCTVPDRLAHISRVDLFAPNGYQLLLRSLRAG